MATRCIKEMKRIALGIALLGCMTGALAQEVTKLGNGNVNISSKGRDVRQVVHDLFVQVGKNYVLDQNATSELYLNLSNVDFDEALEIICHNAGLKYQLRNGIFYIGKELKRPPAKPTVTKEPEGKPVHTETVSRAPIMSRPVSGSFRKKELRQILSDLGRQAGVLIVVAEDIPKRYIDVTFGKTSLGYALSVIAGPLKLRVETRPDGSLYVASRDGSAAANLRNQQ